MRRKPDAPETCAICGATVPPTARACPECGADERTGWSEQSVYDGLDLPEEQSGLSGSRERSPDDRFKRGSRASLWWIVVAVILVVMMLFSGF